MENSKKIIVFYSASNDGIPIKIQGSNLFTDSLEFVYTKNLYDRIIDIADCYCRMDL